MIKAIETTYKGYRFRSRLEARWAVFFDVAGVEWEYEPEGFELPGGARYLPDFFIKGNHQYGPWVEIKGAAPTETEIEKLVALCEAKCAYGVLLWGTPGQHEWLYIHKEGMVQDDSREGFYTGTDLLTHLNCGYRDDANLPSDAIRAARSARFEHGESGARA
jgi:hypothetical protein